MAKRNRKKNIKKVQITSQNVRGIKSELQELFNVISKRNPIAVCLQETWCNDSELMEHGQYKLISLG